MKAGEIADLAEIAATPAIIKACVKGIEKEGKAEFKVFGKKKTLSLGSPTGNPPETRPPPKSHTSPKTSGTSSCAGGKKRAPCLRVETQWGTTTSDILPRTTKTCSGNQYTQACFHYQSVIRENSGYGTLTCPYNKALRAPRPAVALYDAQHNGEWITGRMQGPGLFCQRDEYPPADIWQGRGGQQWIRLIPRADNGGAGPALSRGDICSNPPRSSTVGSHLVRPWRQGNKETESWQLTVEITRSMLVLHFANMQPWADDGLRENPCWPPTLVNDPGFALLTQDDRNDANNLAQLAAYARPPSLQVTTFRPWTSSDWPCCRQSRTRSELYAVTLVSYAMFQSTSSEYGRGRRRWRTSGVFPSGEKASSVMEGQPLGEGCCSAEAGIYSRVVRNA